jgi:hypothetical protein
MLSCLHVCAQNSFSYSYDTSGNRINRSIVLKSAQLDTTQLAKEIFNDEIGEMKIVIYPNPTHGLLKIEFQNVETIHALIRLYNLKGSLIYESLNSEKNADVDLSGQSTGIYILKIVVENQTSEWRIIKQ